LSRFLDLATNSKPLPGLMLRLFKLMPIRLRTGKDELRVTVESKYLH